MSGYARSMVGVLVAIGVLVIVGVAVFAAKFVKHPEQTASQARRDSATTSERFYSGADRPAGPDVDDFVSPGPESNIDGEIRSAGATGSSSAPEEERGPGPNT